MSYFLTEQQRRVLQTERVKLVKQMRNFDEVMNLCIKYDLFNESSCSKILSKPQVSDKIRSLLDDGFPQVSSEKFDIFCALLFITDNKELGGLLTNAVHDRIVFETVMEKEKSTPKPKPDTPITPNDKINQQKPSSEQQSTSGTNNSEDQLAAELAADEENLFSDFLKFSPFSISLVNRKARSGTVVISKGRCLLVSCKNFDNLPSRNGNEVDQLAFEMLFGELGFECEAAQDVTLTELQEQLETEVANLRSMKSDKPYAFLLVVLSYRGSQPDTFLTCDGHEVRLSDVIGLFAARGISSSRCPKIIINYSQVPVEDSVSMTRGSVANASSLAFDLNIDASQLEDALCLCVANAANLKFSELKNGTWFPILFVFIISRYAHTDSIRKMVQRIIHLSKRVDKHLKKPDDAAAQSGNDLSSSQVCTFLALDRLESDFYFDTIV